MHIEKEAMMGEENNVQSENNVPLLLGWSGIPTCAKCEKVVDLETWKRHHGCCSQKCDEDEGFCIMVSVQGR